MTTPTDPFEMFRRLWGPTGLPVPGMAMPTLDPKEIEKRIADLRSIETWLNLNLNMVRMSISGLEVQKSGLDAMRLASGQPVAGTSAGGAPDPGQSPLWPWAALQQAMLDGAAGTKKKPSDES